MDKIKYDEVNEEIKNELANFSQEDCKEIRWSIQKIQADIGYYEYQIYVRKKAINALNEKYVKLLGGNDNASIETK